MIKMVAASSWSSIATFETAALQAGDWQAKWIGDGSKQFEKDEDFYQKDPMPLFRKQISVNKKIAAGKIIHFRAWLFRSIYQQSKNR